MTRRPDESLSWWTFWTVPLPNDFSPPRANTGILHMMQVNDDAARELFDMGKRGSGGAAIARPE